MLTGLFVIGRSSGFRDVHCDLVPVGCGGERAGGDGSSCVCLGLSQTGCVALGWLPSGALGVVTGFELRC